MRKTKFVALLLVVALIASMVVPGVSAAEDYAIKIQSNDSDAITVNAGESFMAKVNLSGNPGISGIATKLVYPEGWTLNAVRNEKLFDSTATSVFTPSETYEANPYSLMWTMPYGTIGDDFEGIPGKQLSFENGLLAQIKLTVPADAVSGTYEVYLTTEGLEKSNYAEPVDASGTIITGEVTRVIPDTSAKLTITVIGTEPEVPAGAACPEHTDVNTWTEVAEGTWTEGAIADGHYKLTGNQTLTKALTVAGNVCIDLNGFNITGPNANNVRVFEIAAEGKLTILDTAETDGVISGGKVYNNTGSSTTEKFGGNIYNAGTFNLYGGVISGGYAYTNSTYYPHVSGGNIYGAEGSTINIYGGVIKDGKVYKPSSYTTGNTAGTTYGLGGGNIYSKGTVTISGGTIANGIVEKKGAVDHYNRRYNYLYGGNIRMNGGQLNITGGEILDGKLIGICANNGKDYNGGPTTAYVRGGSIFAAACDVNISGGTISGGSIDMEVVGDRCIRNDTTDKDKDRVKVSGYFQGGNICVNGGSLEITGGTITGGTIRGKVTEVDTTEADPKATVEFETYGGNICIMGGAVATMTAGSVTDGIADRAEDETKNNIYGGNISVISSQFTMTGGTLSGGYARYRGGNLSVHSGSTATVGGNAIIKDGKTEPVSTGSRGTEACATTAGTTLIIEGNAQLINKDATDALSTVYAITNASIVVNGGRIQGELCAAGTDSNKNGSLTVNGGEFDVITQSSVITNVTIGNGVTFKSASWKYISGEAVVLVDGKYTTYATLADALAAAVAGSKIVLAKDVTAASVAVPAGVTLDLNGKTLTAEAFTSAVEGAQTIDSVGTGKLVSSSASFAADNAQLPVEVNGAFTFETVQFASKYEEVGTKATYKFYIAAEAAATLIDDAILAGDDVALQVKVTWTDANGDAQDKTFVLGAADLALYAGNWDTKMIILTIADISAVSNVNCVAQIVANSVTVGA